MFLYTPVCVAGPPVEGEIGSTFGYPADISPMGDYDALLKHLPPVDFAFAYGSGVFKQEGYDEVKDYSRAPMLDLVRTGYIVYLRVLYIGPFHNQ
jgi:hypothetical protein